MESLALQIVKLLPGPYIKLKTRYISYRIPKYGLHIEQRKDGIVWAWSYHKPLMIQGNSLDDLITRINKEFIR